VPKCLGAELSGHFDTSAEVSSGHFDTGAEVSWYRNVLGPKCPVTVARTREPVRVNLPERAREV